MRRRTGQLMTVGLLALLPGLTGLTGPTTITAARAAAPARAAAAAPCPALPCEGADPSAVDSWAAAPRLVRQSTLPSGARVKLMAGRPSWDSGTEYSWVEGQFTAGKGRTWLVYEYNVFDAAYAYRTPEHPRSYRTTPGTTGMFVKSPRNAGEDAAGCVSDGADTACVGGVNEETVKTAAAEPCDPVCKIVDPATQDLTTWDYVSRPDYRKVTLPSGAWVQQVTGRPKWDRSPHFEWAEAGKLPAGGKVWLEEWQGAGRWGEVYTRVTDPKSARTTDGSTHAFALNNVRACVTDGTDTKCTQDGDTTEPPKAPCDTLPCAGVDPATVTEWTPNGEPTVVEDANVYQGGRLTIYEGRPAWDPAHDYYWGTAELPPRAGVSAQLMTHENKGPDFRAQRPVPIPGASLTASGTTKMYALNPLAPGNTQIAGLVHDGKTWAFATHQGDNMYQTDVEGPPAPCAAQPCTGVPAASVTAWRAGSSAWQTARLTSGAQVSLHGGRPTWSVSDFYAWAQLTQASGTATAWLEDRTPDGPYRRVADAGTLSATSGEYVRACVSDGTETACTTPSA
ncbi:hypothetical protein [Streptomyces sp. NPDC058249]|uniref:hypothetical protein n=1 Tax=Streptomyces sp. NPDC058249 TaxID=3346403 RepID=UPI0036EE8CB1